MRLIKGRVRVRRFVVNCRVGVRGGHTGSSDGICIEITLESG